MEKKSGSVTNGRGQMLMDSSQRASFGECRWTAVDTEGLTDVMTWLHDGFGVRLKPCGTLRGKPSKEAELFMISPKKIKVSEVEI